MHEGNLEKKRMKIFKCFFHLYCILKEDKSF